MATKQVPRQQVVPERRRQTKQRRRPLLQMKSSHEMNRLNVKSGAMNVPWKLERGVKNSKFHCRRVGIFSILLN